MKRFSWGSREKRLDVVSVYLSSLSSLILGNPKQKLTVAYHIAPTSKILYAPSTFPEVAFVAGTSRIFSVFNFTLPNLVDELPINCSSESKSEIYGHE